MTLRLYDTLSRSPRAFEPADPSHVRMYTCGPTVYDRAHIGNFRTFTWEDLLRRYLEWKGWRVTQVMNLTDVDDKTIHAAVERGVTLEEVTEPVIAGFFEDWDTLGLERAEHYPRATEHVAEMIELVETLEEKGYCYEADGSVYFAIDRFPEYGRLARLDPESLRSAGRARGDEEYSKDDPRDFVLWKGGERAEEGDVAIGTRPGGPAGRAGTWSARSWRWSTRVRHWTSTRAEWTTSSRITPTRSRSPRRPPAAPSRASGSTLPTCSSRAPRCPSRRATTTPCSTW